MAGRSLSTMRKRTDRLVELNLMVRVNVTLGEPEDRLMRTGNHTVRDIYCRVCNTIIGWKYVSTNAAHPNPLRIFPPFGPLRWLWSI